jgi:hypothetical protein
MSNFVRQTRNIHAWNDTHELKYLSEQGIVHDYAIYQNSDYENIRTTDLKFQHPDNGKVFSVMGATQFRI